MQSFRSNLEKDEEDWENEEKYPEGYADCDSCWKRFDFKLLNPCKGCFDNEKFNSYICKKCEEIEGVCKPCKNEGRGPKVLKENQVIWECIACKNIEYTDDQILVMAINKTWHEYWNTIKDGKCIIRLKCPKCGFTKLQKKTE